MRKSSWIVVSAAVALSGCAGMSAEECQLADWETIGYEDGVRGASGQAIASHRKSCAKAGVAPDRVAYERGRASGLETYCRPANGYRVGESGHAYSGVCPAELDGATTQAVQEAALAAHRALEIEVYSRVDVLLDSKQRPFVLEANTIPGMTETSLLPKSAAAAGIPFPDLCRNIAEASLRLRTNKTQA